MKKILLSVSMAISAFAFAGMQGHGGMGTAHNMTPMKGLTNNTVVAEVNGKKITVKDVNAYMQGLTKDFRIRLQDLPAQHVKQFVDKYVQTETYYQKAKGVTNSPQFKALMKQMAVELWMRQQYLNIKISDKEAKEFYEKNKDLYFKTTPKLKARHIVVKDEKTAKKIISILEKTPKKDVPKVFAKLAKEYSIGPSKIDGGELGWFDINTMVKPFSQAALKLQKGEFTHTPVKTRFGYHVILLEDKNTKNYIPYKKVKPQIVGFLKQKKLNDELKQIEDQTKVKYFLPTPKTR